MASSQKGPSQVCTAQGMFLKRDYFLRVIVVTEKRAIQVTKSSFHLNLVLKILVLQKYFMHTPHVIVEGKTIIHIVA